MLFYTQGNGRLPDRQQPAQGISDSPSNDPDFAGKPHDVVCLHVAPPAHAVALSFDEKSQTQALGDTQPDLPLKKGREA